MAAWPCQIRKARDARFTTRPRRFAATSSSVLGDEGHTRCWCFPITGRENAEREGLTHYYVPGLTSWQHSRDHVVFACAWYSRKFQQGNWETLLREQDPFEMIVDFLRGNPGAFTFEDRPLAREELRRPLDEDMDDIIPATVYF